MLHHERLALITTIQSMLTKNVRPKLLSAYLYSKAIEYFIRFSIRNNDPSVLYTSITYVNSAFKEATNRLDGANENFFEAYLHDTRPALYESWTQAELEERTVQMNSPYAMAIHQGQ